MKTVLQKWVDEHIHCGCDWSDGKYRNKYLTMTAELCPDDGSALFILWPESEYHPGYLTNPPKPVYFIETHPEFDEDGELVAAKVFDEMLAEDA